MPPGFNGSGEIALRSNYKPASYRLGVLLK